MRILLSYNPFLLHAFPIVVAHILHPSPRHIDGCINFHFTAPLWLKGTLVEWVMCLCVVWACSIFYFGYGWSIGQRGIRNCGNLSVWQPGVVEMSGRLLCFPWLLRLGDQCCRLGWAWLVEGEGDRGALRGFGSALIRVIITTGTRIHTYTYTHTSSGICYWRLSWLLWFPWGRGDNVFGHSAWRAEISPWMQDKLPFITLWTVSEPARTWRGHRKRTRQEGREDESKYARVRAQMTDDRLARV